MKKVLYEKLIIEIPDEFEDMKEEEIEKCYREKIDYVGIDRKTNKIIAIKKQDEVKLEKENVEERIKEYEAVYHRMCPGYKLGELKLKKAEDYNMGIISYINNGYDFIQYNIVGVMNYFGKEVVISMSCRLEQSFEELPKFVKALDSVDILN